MRKTTTAGMIAGYCGKSDELDEAMATFAHGYGDHTERDHATMEKATKSGRLNVAKVF